MRRNNNFIFGVILVFLLVLFTSCGGHLDDNTGEIGDIEEQKIPQDLSAESDKTIYKEIDVHVFHVDMLEKYSYVKCDWLNITEESMFDESDAILKGKVSNIEEIAIEYISNDILKTEYRTRFDYEITEIFYDEENIRKVGEVVKISVPFSTRAYDESITSIINLNEYIVFCESAVKFDSGPVKMSSFIDYGITSPNIGIFFKNDNYYETPDFFVEEYPYKITIADLLNEKENSTEGIIKAIQSEEYSIPEEYLTIDGLNDFVENYDMLRNVIIDTYSSELALSDKIGNTYIIEADVFENIIKNKVNYYLK